MGYTRDNFGNGIYGGGAIQFGDMLGDEQLIFAGYINGSLNQGDFLAAYDAGLPTCLPAPGRSLWAPRLFTRCTAR